MLENKVALITGASRGIGRAIAEKFAEEGAIVFAGIRDTAKSGELASDNITSGGKVVPILLDVCDKDTIKQCVINIKKQYGRLDVLVNNAGLTIIERLEMVSSVSMDKIYSTNVFGFLHMTQMAMRLLKKSDRPSIINMSSIMWENSDIGQTAYASSKAAVVSMTKTWAKEYAPSGLRVNAIAPGNVDTEMFNIIDEQEKKYAIDKIGLGRLARPEEIANVALFLASDMASYVTGEVIAVNGALVL